MLADASGFTKLTNILTADEMSVVLTNFFTKMIDIISKYGGDVLKFAGDALIIFFPPGEDVSHKGVACALEMSDELHNYTAARDNMLSLHVALLKIPKGYGDGLKGIVLGKEGGNRFEVSGSESTGYEGSLRRYIY